MKQHPHRFEWAWIATLMLATSLFPPWCLGDEPDALPASGSTLSLEAFKRIPILDEGRKMPMDTYARHVLLRFSGRSSYEGRPAAEWLARVLFNPREALTDKIFLINHPEVAHALGIPVAEKRKYSLEHLQGSWMKLRDLAEKASRIDDKERSEVESECLRVFGNLAHFFELAESFHFTRPNENFRVTQEQVKKTLNLPANRDQFSFFEIYQRAHLITPEVEKLVDKNSETWTPLEQEMFLLSSNLFETSRRNRSLRFTVIPFDAHGEEVWMSVWDVFTLEVRDQGLASAVQNLHDLSTAYEERDQEKFDRAATNVRLFAESRLPGDREMKFNELEVKLNEWNPFIWSKLLYFLTFLLGFVSLLTLRRSHRVMGLVFAGLALLPHTVGIIARMLIMGRPPVTNLYATFLFVAWICVILGVIMELLQKNGIGLLASGFSGITLLLLASKFALQGDTMGKVVAVLDSNFWLSTHVIAITTGYAGCVLAGLIGHIYLICAAIAPGNRERLSAVYRALYGTLGFGLIFAFLGTMLGGVWADQSWGRFWGWDPKENGALLIVLWCSILFHARFGRMISDIGMAAGSALGIIVVMLAWLGVNLLGVGLHSYGFTSGLALGLLAYIVAQVLIVAILVPVAQRRTLRVAG